MSKNAVELVKNKKSLGFFNRLFLVSKPNNKWRPILDLSKLNLFLKAEKFKMETPETIRTSLQQGEWVTSIDLKDAYFHIPIQEQSRSDIPIQSSAFWSIHSALWFHCCNKGGETDGHTQGYKNPPVPRGLVGESQVPSSLSPAYPGPIETLSRPRLAGEFRKVRTGTKADLRFCMLPVQPQGRSDPTDTGPLAESSGQNSRKSVTTGLSSPAVHVSDRFTNSHWKASLPRLTSHETHTVASQKQLEGTRVTRKGNSNTKVLAPTFTTVATRGQCPYRPTITSNKTCSANLYRRIKRRVGCSLKWTHCKRNLVPSRKQAGI